MIPAHLSLRRIPTDKTIEHVAELLFESRPLNHNDFSDPEVHKRKIIGIDMQIRHGLRKTAAELGDEFQANFPALNPKKSPEYQAMVVAIKAFSDFMKKGINEYYPIDHCRNLTMPVIPFSNPRNRNSYWITY